MSIKLEPEEVLRFERPFTSEVIRTLEITNENSDPVAFKVKTTAPKQYCVRPNSGRIESGRTVRVEVILQAMKEDPPPEYKCRDKFLVQSVLITADREASNVQTIWSQMEQKDKTAIVERKIRVQFLQPGQDTTSSRAPSHQFDSSPPPYSDPSAVSALAPSAPVAAVGPVSKPESKPFGAPSSGDAVRDAVTLSGTGSLEKQLAEARATIARLEAEMSEQGLRLRKTSGVASDAKERVTAGAAGMGLTTQPPEGIPVQICAALCLAAFLIAWFFF